MSRLTDLVNRAVASSWGTDAYVGTETLHGVFTDRWMEAVNDFGAAVSVRMTSFGYDRSLGLDPDVGETLTIGATTYRIRDKQPDEGNWTVLELEKLSS